MFVYTMLYKAAALTVESGGPQEVSEIKQTAGHVCYLLCYSKLLITTYIIKFFM